MKSGNFHEVLPWNWVTHFKSAIFPTLRFLGRPCRYAVGPVGLTVIAEDKPAKKAE